MRPGNWNIAAAARKVSGTPIHPRRGPYTLTMRECAGTTDVLQRLCQVSGPRTRLHLGWGSFRNLDIVAARKSSYCLLCDINVHQLRLWQSVAEALHQARTPAGFCSLLPGLVPTSPPPRQFAESMEHWLSGDMERPESWLTPTHLQRYEHVRGLFAGGRVGVLCLDLRDTGAGGIRGMRRFDLLEAELVQARKRHGIFLDTLYVSNIGYMLAQPSGFFGEDHSHQTAAGMADPLSTMQENLRRLSTASTWLIRAERLREGFTADNLQWLTELEEPRAQP